MVGKEEKEDSSERQWEGSGWRTLTCVLVYVYAYAIGYSFYRRGELEV